LDGFLRWFAGWMDGGGAPWFVAGMVVFTFPLVVVHEVGHAAVCLLATDGSVTLRAGRSPGLWRGRLGRLRFELHPLMPQPGSGERAGQAGTRSRITPLARLLMFLAGPFASLAAAALAFAALSRVHGGGRRFFLAAAVALGAFHAVWNLIPNERRGWRSDGRRALDTIRLMRGRELDSGERWRRFRALVTGEEGGELRTTERAETLGRGVSRLLELDGTRSDPLVRTAGRAAYVGWCWRHIFHVSAVGDPQVNEALRHAYQLRGDAVSTRIEAACTLTRSTSETPSGSPRDSAEQRDQLARRLTNADTSWSDGGLSRDQAELATRYGIELHDVEQAAGII